MGTEVIVAAVITALIAAASTYMTLQAQQQQAEAQADFQKRAAEARNRQIESNYALAMNAYQQQTNEIARRVAQEEEKASNEDQRNALAAAQARATIRTASGEAGVSGLSVNALLRDFQAQESRYRDALHRNNDLIRENADQEAEAAKMTYEGRGGAIKPIVASPIAQPQYLAESFKLAGTIFNTYNKYSSATPASQPNASWPAINE